MTEDIKQHLLFKNFHSILFSFYGYHFIHLFQSITVWLYEQSLGSPLQLIFQLNISFFYRSRDLFCIFNDTFPIWEIPDKFQLFWFLKNFKSSFKLFINGIPFIKRYSGWPNNTTQWVKSIREAKDLKTSANKSKRSNQPNFKTL